jgi:hypothetical protein
MVILRKSLKKLQKNLPYYEYKTMRSALCSLQTFERIRNETSNVETHFVDASKESNK